MRLTGTARKGQDQAARRLWVCLFSGFLDCLVMALFTLVCAGVMLVLGS